MVRITKQMVLDAPWKENILEHIIRVNHYVGNPTATKQKVIEITKIKKWKELPTLSLTQSQIDKLLWVTRDVAFFKSPDVAKMLNVTKNNIKYAMNKNWIQPTAYASARMYSQTVKVPYFSVTSILKLKMNPLFDEYLDKSKSRTAKRNKRLAIEHAERERLYAIKRAKREAQEKIHKHEVLEEAKTFYKELKESHSHTPRDAAYMLCYLAQLASRIAKTSIRPCYYYDKKKTICEILYKKGWLKVSFNHSNRPDKIIWGSQWNEVADTIEDYYELYYLESDITNLDGFKFSYHFPYLSNQIWLPNKDDLKWIQQIENYNTRYRFGQEASEVEVCISSFFNWNKEIDDYVKLLNLKQPDN